MGVALAIKVPTVSFLMFLTIQRKFGPVSQAAKTLPFQGSNESSTLSPGAMVHCRNGSGASC